MSRHLSPKATRKRPLRRTEPATDSISILLEEWRRERPDLDPAPFAIFGRIWRLSANLSSCISEWLAPLGLNFESFSLIVTLRRSGAPYELNPTALYRESLISSGAITNRIDRVEALGLVRRRPDPVDRRGTIVRLTPKGRALADKAIKLHFEKLADCLSGMSSNDQAGLALLLANLLRSVESRKEPRAARQGE
jgi:DNA-binding MarR family transcriptional regulator